MSGIELGAAFAMGLMGSTHCVAMCGPISTVLSSPGKRRLPMAGEGESSARAGFGTRAATQGGRITTYAALGALVGALGAGIQRAIELESLQLAARFAAAAVLLGAGLYIAGVFRRFGRIEKIASPVLAPLRRWIGGSRATGVGGHFVRGLGWGLLPCGLVLGGLSLAVLTGTPYGGAATMLAFGLGTLPALFAVDVFASTFQRLMRSVWLKRVAGTLIVLSGVVQGALAIEGAESLGKPAQRPCCAHRQHAG
ncbi:MAG: sulfite exporter TauE/SafE family protein [Polyangiaceae bacterium]